MITTQQEKISQCANDNPCVCFNLRKAARQVTQVYDDMFRPIGIKPTQAMVLNSLRMLGTVTVSQLAEALVTDRTTITRNLKPLERDGLINTHPGQDRREREIVITRKGQDIAIKATLIWEKFQKQIDQAIGKERLENLCREISDTLEKIQNL